MASFDSDNSYSLNAFDFDAFSLDFILSLGINNLTLTNRNSTLGLLTEITTNAPDALVVTSHQALLNAASFANTSFDEALSFSSTSFAVDIDTGTLVVTGSDALTVAEFAVTIEGALTINTNAHGLVVTEYGVTLGGLGDITTIVDPLVVTEHPTGLQIGSEIINAPDVLPLSEHATSVHVSRVGSLATLTLTEYPVGLAQVVETQVGITNLSIVAPQVASIDYTPGSGGFITVGTTLNPLTLTEYAADKDYSPTISATRNILAVQPHSSNVQYVTTTRAVTDELIVTEHTATIGFNWQATMGFDQLYLYTRGLSKEGNIFEITQPLSQTIPEDIPVNF